MNVSRIELLRSQLKTYIPGNDLEYLSDATDLSKHISIILDQMKHLRNSVESTIEMSKIKGVRANASDGLSSCFKIFLRLNYALNAFLLKLYVQLNCGVLLGDIFLSKKFYYFQQIMKIIKKQKLWNFKNK